MNIQQIKEKYTCLDYLGDKVVKKTATGWLCRAPWREDKHPSLTVTANGKGWQDHTTGESGNIIDMVMKSLNTTDLRLVCSQFDAIKPFPFDQSKFNVSKEKDSGFRWIEYAPLTCRALYAYLHSRRINTEIAKQFLQEAHYSFRDEHTSFLYALAYPNNLGGYELRSKYFKGSSSPKGITTHLDRENASVVVFEGFMDMLSFATLCGGVKHNYIVLNSIVNKDAAIEVLRTYKGRIYLALDNDEGGSTTTRDMLDVLPSAIDIRSRFAPAKDVNDYLLQKQK